MENYTEFKTKSKSKPMLRNLVRLSLILITMIVSVVMVNRFIFRSQATVDIATVVFSPKTHQLSKGQTFSQIVRLNAGEKKISGLDLTFNYRSNYLSYLPQASDLLVNTVPSNYFTQVVMENSTLSNTNDGKVRIVLIANKPDTDLLSNVVISLRFKALETVSSTTLAFNEPASIIVGTTGTTSSLDHTFDLDSTEAASQIVIASTISCTADAQCGAHANCSSNSTCQCQDGYYNCDNVWTNGCESDTICQPAGAANVQLKIKLQGVNTTPRSTNKIKVKVRLVGSRNDNGQVFNDLELVSSSENDGVFVGNLAFNNLDLSDRFKVFVKGPKHIQKRFCDLNPQGGLQYICSSEQGLTLTNGAVLNFSGVPLLAGDLPIPEQDGILNSKDVSAIKNCIKTPSVACIAQTDVNYDGATNGTDFTIVLNSMTIKYDDEN